MFMTRICANWISRRYHHWCRGMRFGNRKLRQQQALQYELEKTKLSWKKYRERAG